MKREALNHTKMKRLCRKLDVPNYCGVGILESIWQLTAREAPAGDLGKLSDEDIALGIDYRGDEKKLVEALLSSGWLDSHSEFRLVVHDWSEHADDAVHMRMARSQAYFADGSHPRLARLSHKERECALAFYTPSAYMRTPSAQYSDPCAQNDDLSALPRQSPAPPEPRQSPAPPDKQTQGPVVCEIAAASEDPSFVRSSPPAENPEAKPKASGPIQIPRKPMPTPPPKSDADARLREVAEILHTYMRLDSSGNLGQYPAPPDGVVIKCAEITRHVPIADVRDYLLLERWRAGKQKRGRRGGPDSYPWFITVLQARFGRDGPAGTKAEVATVGART